MTSGKNTKACVITKKEVLLWRMVIESRNCISIWIVWIAICSAYSCDILHCHKTFCHNSHTLIMLRESMGKKGGTHLWGRRKRKESNFRGVDEWS
jgi:hypothetical protein